MNPLPYLDLCSIYRSEWWVHGSSSDVFPLARVTVGRERGIGCIGCAVTGSTISYFMLSVDLTFIPQHSSSQNVYLNSQAVDFLLRRLPCQEPQQLGLNHGRLAGTSSSYWHTHDSYLGIQVLLVLAAKPRLHPGAHLRGNSCPLHRCPRD